MIQHILRRSDTPTCKVGDELVAKATHPVLLNLWLASAAQLPLRVNAVCVPLSRLREIASVEQIRRRVLEFVWWRTSAEVRTPKHISSVPDPQGFVSCAARLDDSLFITNASSGSLTGPG